MSELRDQTTSTTSVPNCSQSVEPDEQNGLSELKLSAAHKPPETNNECEHMLKARKQYTHLPVDCQATLDARHSNRNEGKCDECAVLEDIVANKCEKCLFAQELASHESSRKNSEARNLPDNPNGGGSPLLKKRRAPTLPSAPSLRRTITKRPCNAVDERELTAQKGSELPGKKVNKDVTNKNVFIADLCSGSSSLEVFKRENKNSQFAGSNVYVIQPTFKQTIRPLTYQAASKGVQYERLKRTSRIRKISTRYPTKYRPEEDVGRNESCGYLDVELDSTSNKMFSDSGSSSDQEEEETLSARIGSKSRHGADVRKRSVLLQCNLPKMRSKSLCRPKSKVRSKSVSPTKTKRRHEYDGRRASFSETCLDSSLSSESSLKSKNYFSPLYKKPGGSQESDTQIVVEEKIYVRCPPDSIRKKKITTGNKSILSGKSLASDIRSFLCDDKSRLFITKSPSFDEEQVKDEKKSIMKNARFGKRDPSPNKKLISSIRGCQSPDKRSIRSRKNSVSPDKRSRLLHSKSEHSDNRSWLCDDRTDYSDEEPGKKLATSIKKSPSPAKKSTCSRRNSVSPDKRSLVLHSKPEYLDDGLDQFHDRTNHRDKKPGNVTDQSFFSDEKCVCFDEKSIGSYKEPNDAIDGYSSYDREAVKQSESDFCVDFRKQNDTDNEFSDSLNGTDTDFDYEWCGEVDSTVLQAAYHSASAARESKISKKPYKSLSQEVDMEAGNRRLRPSPTRHIRSDSHSSVFFKIIRMSRISCVFITLIILIIIFFVSMLVWRIVNDPQ